MRVLGRLKHDPVETKWAAPDFTYHYEFVTEQDYAEHTPFSIFWNNATNLGIMRSYPESKCESSAVPALIGFTLINADKHGQLLINFNENENHP